MNTTTHTSPIDLYRQGVTILTNKLGPVDSIRFLRLLDQGSGDYTAIFKPALARGASRVIDQRKSRVWRS